MYHVYYDTVELGVEVKKIGPLDCCVVGGPSSSCVVLFHGYGADCTNLTPLAKEVGGDFTWIFPNGVLEIPDSMGRAWFKVDVDSFEQALMQGAYRDLSEHRPLDIESIYQKVCVFFDEVASRFDEVILGGFSQGAMLSTEVALRASAASEMPAMLATSAKLRALVILSGTLLSQKQWSQWALQGPGMRFFQSHGGQDHLLSFQHAENLFHMLMASQWRGEFHAFQGKHEIPLEVVASLKKFLGSLS